MLVKPFIPKDGLVSKNIEIMFCVEFSQIYCMHVKKIAKMVMLYPNIVRSRDKVIEFIENAKIEELNEMFKVLNNILEMLTDIFYRLNLDKNQIELIEAEKKEYALNIQGSVLQS